jgi:hypothetical protein
MGGKNMNQDLNMLAEALVFVHGKGAEAEAARHASLCERSGDYETAEAWRTLQRDLHERGPRRAA